jgi:hypothetical protein
MDNYNEYIEERLYGMYNLLESSNSIALEGFKKKTPAESVHKHKGAFINYIVYKYNDPNIRYEFKNAKSDKEREALINKYSGDFEEWVKRQKGLMAGIRISLASLGVTAAGAPGIGLMMSYVCWGIVIKTFVNDAVARDKAAEDKYLKERKNKK